MIGHLVKSLIGHAVRSQRRQKHGFVGALLIAGRLHAGRGGMHVGERLPKHLRRDSERRGDQNDWPSIVARVGVMAAAKGDWDLPNSRGLRAGEASCADQRNSYERSNPKC